MTISPLSALSAVDFVAPPVNPSPLGLYAATTWTEASAGAAMRELNGVLVRGISVGGENQSGMWDAAWCGPPPVGRVKDGVRPSVGAPFPAMVPWAYDECDATAVTRGETIDRATQILRITEQTQVEREFAARLLDDAADTTGGVVGVATLKAAVAYLDGVCALTGVVGYIHVGAHQVALEAGLFARNGSARNTPMGNVVVPGGGYVDGLGATLVATTAPYGWRSPPVVRGALSDTHPNIYGVVAERTVVIGYEAALGAATIT